jgi:hypothetical protein
LFTLHGSAQKTDRKPATVPAKKQPKIAEELTLKNGDRLTGELLSATGKEIKFKSELAGTVTVQWSNVKDLKSNREFAVISTDENTHNAKNIASVPQGAIRIGEKGIVISPVPAAAIVQGPSKSDTPAAKRAAEVVVPTELPLSKVAYVVDDESYLKEIHQRIGWRSGWDGHVATGTTMIFSTQDSYLFQASAALKRVVPTVDWLDPKVRTILDASLSAGRTTQPGVPPSITNIYHVEGERDEYFSPRGYALQSGTLDHNYAQGLILQQAYGVGVGATLIKKKQSEFDVTADLHYESQVFKPTANVSQLNLNLIASALTEAYTQKWGRMQFDEKLLADVAWSNWNASSGSGNASVIMPIYKKLGFSVSAIDSFLNNPQVGYKKNSFQFTTGFALSLH